MLVHKSVYSREEDMGYTFPQVVAADVDNGGSLSIGPIYKLRPISV